MTDWSTLAIASGSAALFAGSLGYAIGLTINNQTLNDRVAFWRDEAIMAGKRQTVTLRILTTGWPQWMKNELCRRIDDEAGFDAHIQRLRQRHS